MEDSSKALLMFAFKSVKEKTEKTKPKLSSTFCSQLKKSLVYRSIQQYHFHLTWLKSKTHPLIKWNFLFLVCTFFIICCFVFVTEQYQRNRNILRKSFEGKVVSLRLRWKKEVWQYYKVLLVKKLRLRTVEVGVCGEKLKLLSTGSIPTISLSNTSSLKATLQTLRLFAICQLDKGLYHKNPKRPFWNHSPVQFGCNGAYF